MSESQRGVLSELLLEKSNVSEIFIVAVAIALGVSLIANSIGSLLGFSPFMTSMATLLLGLALCMGSILYLLTKVVRGSTRFRSYEGFFVYDEKKNRILDVPRYDFSSELSDYFNSALYEDKAMKVIWEREPLRSLDEELDKGGKPKSPRSRQFIREAVEYYVLDLLSTHLTSYFNEEKFRKEYLKEFERNDIPDVLLKNRFLELFSRPMEQRSCFVEGELARVPDEKGRVIASFRKGARFMLFSLVLPKESTVRRLEENEVEVDTERFKVVITTDFKGNGTTLPDELEFMERYLSLKGDLLPRYHVYEVNVDVNVHFGFGRLLTRTDWKYYRWIDTFLGNLDKKFSKRTFFKQIGWSFALTAAKCTEVASKKGLSSDDA